VTANIDIDTQRYGVFAVTSTSTQGTEQVYIIRIDGTRFGPFSSIVDSNKALIYEVTLNAGKGDRIELHDASGEVQTHVITNTHFQPQMSDIAAHYTLRWR
jgi:hypothetical protein